MNLINEITDAAVKSLQQVRNELRLSGVRFVKLGEEARGYGLGGTYTNYIAIKDGFFVLCLVGSDIPYQPIGSKKTLKEVIIGSQEGAVYYWKEIEKEV